MVKQPKESVVPNLGTASFNVRNCQFPRAELTVSLIVTVWNFRFG